MLYTVEQEKGFSDFFYCSLSEDTYELPHIHSHIEFIFAIYGDTKVMVGTTTFNIKKGQVLFITPYQPHKRFNDDNAFTMACPIEYAPEFKTILKNSYFSPSIIKFSPATRELINEIITNEDSDAKKKALLYLIFALFMEQAKLLSKNQINTDTYRSAIAHISEHYSEKLTLSSVANYLGVTSSHLSRVLNTQGNTGFSDVLNSIRVHVARNLLKQSNLTCTEIAYEVGFGSVRNFNRIFKKYFNNNPTVLKKQLNQR